MKSHEATWELAMRDYIDISTKFAASKFKLLWVTGSVASKLQQEYGCFQKALNYQSCKKKSNIENTTNFIQKFL